MSQLLVSLLQVSVGHSFNLQLLKVEPEDTVNMGSPPALEFYPVGYVSHFHGVVLAEDHLLPESLDPMLKVSSGEEDIVLHHLVHFVIDVISEVLLLGHL